MQHFAISRIVVPNYISHHAVPSACVNQVHEVWQHKHTVT